MRYPAQGQCFGLDLGGFREEPGALRRAQDQQPGACFRLNAPNKSRRAVKVDRNDLDASSHTAPKCGNPFRAVFPPQEDPVSFLESVLVEENDKTADEFEEIEIGEFPGAVTVAIANGFAVSKRPHVIEQIDTMVNIKVRGLMCMAPMVEDPEEARSVFVRCQELFDEISSEGAVDEKFNLLSMGMSNDFEVAIECGSNLVRIGSEIFGQSETIEADLQ